MYQNNKGDCEMRIAIITGASSGMGMEFARQIDRKCLGLEEIWLIARSREPMEQLAAQLQIPVRIFAMDLTVSDSYAEFLMELARQKTSVRLLINCAGYGKTGAFSKLNESECLGMIDLNCRALTKVTYRILPFMPRRSYIIQLASAAAFLPQPGFGVYAATKSYVLSFARGLNEELRHRGISVTAVCPGPVDTPFFDIAEQTGQKFMFKQGFMLPKEKVVEKALRDTFRQRELSVCGLPMKGLQLGCKLIPHRLILRIYENLVKINS